MHELSIAETILEQALRVAAQERAAAIARVRVRVGDLSGVDPDALKFAFPIAARGTVAEGAALEAIRVPFEVACRRCGAWSRPEPWVPACAACGSQEVDTVAGRELRIESLDLCDRRG